MCMYVCVRACVRACVCVRARVPTHMMGVLSFKHGLTWNRCLPSRTGAPPLCRRLWTSWTPTHVHAWPAPSRSVPRAMSQADRRHATPVARRRLQVSARAEWLCSQRVYPTPANPAARVSLARMMPPVDGAASSTVYRPCASFCLAAVLLRWSGYAILPTGQTWGTGPCTPPFASHWPTLQRTNRACHISPLFLVHEVSTVYYITTVCLSVQPL